jgi:hypothetical protein
MEISRNQLLVIQEALDFYISQTETSLQDLSLIPEERRSEIVSHRLHKLNVALSSAKSVKTDIEILLLKN